MLSNKNDVHTREGGRPRRRWPNGRAPVHGGLGHTKEPESSGIRVIGKLLHDLWPDAERVCDHSVGIP